MENLFAVSAENLKEVFKVISESYKNKIRLVDVLEGTEYIGYIEVLDYCEAIFDMVQWGESPEEEIE